MVKRNTKIVTAIISASIMTSVATTSVSAKVLKDTNVGKQLNMMETKIKIDAENGITKHKDLMARYDKALKDAVNNHIIDQVTADKKKADLTNQLDSIKKTSEKDKQVKSNKNKQARKDLKDKLFGYDKTFQIMQEDNDFKNVQKFVNEYKNLVTQGEKNGLLTSNEVSRTKSIIQSIKNAKTKYDKKKAKEDFKTLVPAHKIVNPKHEKTPVEIEKEQDEAWGKVADKVAKDEKAKADKLAKEKATLKAELEDKLFGYNTTLRIRKEDNDFKGFSKFADDYAKLIHEANVNGVIDNTKATGLMRDLVTTAENHNKKVKEQAERDAKVQTVSDHQNAVDSEKNYDDVTAKYYQDQMAKNDRDKAVVGEHNNVVDNEKNYEDTVAKYYADQSKKTSKTPTETKTVSDVDNVSEWGNGDDWETLAKDLDKKEKAEAEKTIANDVDNVSEWDNNDGWGKLADEIAKKDAEKKAKEDAKKLAEKEVAKDIDTVDEWNNKDGWEKLAEEISKKETKPSVKPSEDTKEKDNTEVKNDKKTEDTEKKDTTVKPDTTKKDEVKKDDSKVESKDSETQTSDNKVKDTDKKEDTKTTDSTKKDEVKKDDTVKTDGDKTVKDMVDEIKDIISKDTTPKKNGNEVVALSTKTPVVDTVVKKVVDSKKLPKTGGTAANMLIGFGSTLAIAGAFLLRKFRK